MVSADVELVRTIPAIELERQRRRESSDEADLWLLLDAVKDPELPVLSLWDLGVLQDVQRLDEVILVTITPTYSGCPALSVMTEDIESVLSEAGFEQVKVQTRLSPAWTTDWLSRQARQHLSDYGIAPPGAGGPTQCPQCGGTGLSLISEFGSTACKALYRCDTCAEPFDYFKTL